MPRPTCRHLPRIRVWRLTQRGGFRPTYEQPGRRTFVLASANTLGATNAPPLVGPVVLSEIMYHPPDLEGADNDLDEYLELRNLTTTNVTAPSPAYPTNTWRLRKAVEFDFPPGVTLPPAATCSSSGLIPPTPRCCPPFGRPIN
jgi:hypothetical protein